MAIICSMKGAIRRAFLRRDRVQSRAVGEVRSQLDAAELRRLLTVTSGFGERGAALIPVRGALTPVTDS
jgi:hypothetical protein